MTKLRVTSGICGFSTLITATMQEDKKTVAFTLESDCKMVQRFAQDMALLNKMDTFKAYLHNPVYKAAHLHLKHIACLVPAGVLKALEVEAGFCLAKDACVEFLKDG